MPQHWMNRDQPRMPRPEDGLLKEHLRLEKEVNAAGETRYQILPLNRELSFDKGFYVFIRALQLLCKHNRGCTIVGLAGASGSGKTTFTQRVKTTMTNVAILSMDMYNDGSKVRENNFDDPRLADYDLLLENLQDLKAGRPCRAPVYDFKESRRSGYVEIKVPESRIIIVEGIYALSARLAPLLDLRVAITGGIHFDLVKRVIRDINRSGQEANEIIQQISDTVYPMYKVYIEPDLMSAHIKIYNNFNPFAGFKDPIYILKTEDSVPLDVVRSVLADVSNADPSTILEESETEAYDIFLLPPGEDIQECQSWLRMRNKEGRYTLMFAEWFVNEPFIISPRISFEVPVKLLGGLMALGYTIGSIMSRKSVRLKGSAKDDVSVKWDRIEKLGCFMQIQGSDRDSVMDVANRLGIKHFVPRSYIEQVQLLKLTQDFTEVNEEARRRFAFDKGAIIDDHVIGASPARQLVFHNHAPPPPRALRPSDTLSSSMPAHRHTWSQEPSGDALARGLSHQRLESDGEPVRGLLSQQLRASDRKARGGGGDGGGSRRSASDSNGLLRSPKDFGADMQSAEFDEVRVNSKASSLASFAS